MTDWERYRLDLLERDRREKRAMLYGWIGLFIFVALVAYLGWEMAK